MRSEGGREVNHHGKMITVGGEEEPDEALVVRTVCFLVTKK